MTNDDIDRRIARDIFGWHSFDFPCEPGERDDDGNELHSTTRWNFNGTPFEDLQGGWTQVELGEAPPISSDPSYCHAMKCHLRRAGVCFVVHHGPTVLVRIAGVPSPIACGVVANTEPEAVARFAVALLDSGLLKPKVQP